MVVAAPMLPAGYVVNASRIADRRMILAAYRACPSAEVGLSATRQEAVPPRGNYCTETKENPTVSRFTGEKKL